MCRLSWNLGASTSWNPQALSRPLPRIIIIFFFVNWPTKHNYLLVSLQNNKYLNYASCKHWHDTGNLHVPSMLGAYCSSRHGSYQVLKMASTWCTHAQTPCRFEGPGAVANGLTGITNALVMRGFISNWLWILSKGISDALTDKNTKNWRRKPFAGINWYELPPPFFGVRKSLLNLSKHFRYTLYNSSCIGTVCIVRMLV